MAISQETFDKLRNLWKEDLTPAQNPGTAVSRLIIFLSELPRICKEENVEDFRNYMLEVTVAMRNLHLLSSAFSHCFTVPNAAEMAPESVKNILEGPELIDKATMMVREAFRDIEISEDAKSAIDEMLRDARITVMSYKRALRGERQAGDDNQRQR